MNQKKGLDSMENNVSKNKRINLYLASKKQVFDDIYVYPDIGLIERDNGSYTGCFREYARGDKLYIVIDGTMYNKAKLIYDSVNKDSLPNKRYKVITISSDYQDVSINNLRCTDINANDELKTLDEIVTVLLDGIETEINVNILIERLISNKYLLITKE